MEEGDIDCIWCSQVLCACVCTSALRACVSVSERLEKRGVCVCRVEGGTGLSMMKVGGLLSVMCRSKYSQRLKGIRYYGALRCERYMRGDTLDLPL